MAVAVGLGLAIAAASLAQAAVPESYGIWRNPKDSVHVEVKPCGEGACGVVIWANEKAQADSKRGGTDNLIGLTLFRNFIEVKDGIWKGKVFVPDLNGTFSGTAEVLNPRSIRAKGCAFAGMGCKSQVWVRIDGE
jgi:uncharacterized protein (DUF2147 family)